MSDEKTPKKVSQGDQFQKPRLNENRRKDASLLDRVGTSASGLVQSFSGRSVPITVSSDLASLHASASKGESSSSSRDGLTSAPIEASAVNQDQDGRSKLLGTAEPFRTRPVYDASSVQETFDHWSRPSGNLPANDLISNKIKESFNGHLPIRTGETPVDTTLKSLGGRQYGDIVETDGAAVTSLLSQPDFDVDFVPSDTWNPTSDSQESDVENSWLIDRSNRENVLSTSSAFSKQKHSSILSKPSNLNAEARLTAHVEASKGTPPSEGHSLESNGLQSFKNDRPLLRSGLIPNFGESDCDQIENNMDENKRHDITREMMTADGQLKPWLAILDKYHDEVWGDMLPLVHEAREEIKKAKDNKDQLSESPRVGPAVRRLQMVLQHMSNLQN